MKRVPNFRSSKLGTFLSFAEFQGLSASRNSFLLNTVIKASCEEINVNGNIRRRFHVTDSLFVDFDAEEQVNNYSDFLLKKCHTEWSHCNSASFQKDESVKGVTIVVRGFKS